MLQIILLVALSLRLFNIEKLTTFSGDQGFDFLQIKSIIDGNISLLGPKIGPYNELGNLYLGPAYYYLLAPFLRIFNFDPIGPAVETAILSVLTVWVIYIFCKKYFGQLCAYISSSLFAFSPFIISQSRAPSNPHLIPFFSILAVYATSQALFENKRNYFNALIAGFCAGITFQLHYIATALVISSITFMLINKRTALVTYMLAGFMVAILPQMIFEASHDFFVSRLLLSQVAQGDSIFSLKTLGVNSQSSFISLGKLVGNNYIVGLLVFLAILIVVLKGKYFRSKNQNKLTTFFSILVFLNVIFVSIYPGGVNLHYFAILYPVVFIVVGLVLTRGLEGKSLVAKSLAAMAIILLAINSIINLNLQSREGHTMPKGWNLSGQKKATKMILNDSNSNAKFNVASTLDGDTRAMPIRYLLTKDHKPPLDVERYPESATLYLVSRDAPDEVLNYNVWEVQSYKPFEIISKAEIQNQIYLYKLKKI